MKPNVDFMNELRDYIEKNSEVLGFDILYGSRESGYFTVENKEGYRAYAQIDVFPLGGIDVSVVYKPSKGHGSGKRMFDMQNAEIDRIIYCLKSALGSAIHYEKDPRQPKSRDDEYIRG